MLNAVKKACRISVTDFDDELQLLIMAAYNDLHMVGIDHAREMDPSVQRAVITYCRLNFGSPADFDRLKKIYDEQRAQLMTATGYGFEDDEE